MQIAQSVGNRLGIGDQLLQFFLQYKWWWLSPIILMLLWLAGLVIFGQSSAHPAFMRPVLYL
jgi:hypothetical protein